MTKAEVNEIISSVSGLSGRFSTSKHDYWQFQKWASKQRWWNDFLTLKQDASLSDLIESCEVLTDPLRGSIIFAEFVKANPHWFKTVALD